MHVFNNTKHNTTHLFFNHFIAQFQFIKQFVSNHDQHFKDGFWHELNSLLGFEHQIFLSYFPQGNGKVEDINNILKVML